MELTTSELIKSIHQYMQDDYEKRLFVTACNHLKQLKAKVNKLESRLKELENVQAMFDDYIEYMSAGYPSECRKILDNIKEVFDDNKNTITSE